LSPVPLQPTRYRQINDINTNNVTQLPPPELIYDPAQAPSSQHSKRKSICLIQKFEKKKKHHSSARKKDVGMATTRSQRRYPTVTNEISCELQPVLTPSWIRLSIFCISSTRLWEVVWKEQRTSDRLEWEDSLRVPVQESDVVVVVDGWKKVGATPSHDSSINWNQERSREQGLNLLFSSW